MPSRVFGRPYVLTEVNYCYPNRFRSEYAPMFGGYAALQDWDGIYRFAWSHARETLNNQMIGGFDIAKDPAAQLADRLVHALFLRGDLSPAPEQLAIRFDGGELYRDAGRRRRILISRASLPHRSSPGGETVSVGDTHR